MPRKRRNQQAERRPTAADDRRDDGLPASAEPRQAMEIDARIQRHVTEHLDTRLREITEIRAEWFTGPLPHPDHLRDYENVLAGASDRIITMTEQQAAHRRKIKSRQIEASIKFEARGQWFAFILAAMAIFGGIYLISEDKEVAGLAAVISPIVALTGVFIYARRQKRRELSADAKQRMDQPSSPSPPAPPA